MSKKLKSSISVLENVIGQFSIKKKNMSKLLENTDYSELDDFLPISSENDLKMIENTLKWCRTFKFVLIEELTRRCWTENLQIIHLIKLIMPYLFDDSVLVNYAVYDKQATQPKKNFCDLLVCNVIFTTILECGEYGDRYNEVKMKVKAYLSQSPYRLKRRDAE